MRRGRRSFETWVQRREARRGGTWAGEAGRGLERRDVGAGAQGAGKQDVGRRDVGRRDVARGAARWDVGCKGARLHTDVAAKARGTARRERHLDYYHLAKGSGPVGRLRGGAPRDGRLR